MRDPLVLCYHAVSASWDADISVTPAQLERHVRLLLRLGYRAATFSDALLAPSDRKIFAVTFDDGYRSVGEDAAPVLARLDVPATLFVAPQRIDEGVADWKEMRRWQKTSHRGELELLDWPALRALARSGWEIGSHSHSHARLAELEDAPLHDELVFSREAIEERLGRPCPSVAYPYGSVNRRVVRAAQRAGYRTGAGLPDLGRMAKRSPSTRMNWNRVGVYACDHTPRYQLKLATALLQAAGSRAAQPDARYDAPSTPTSGEPRVAVIIPCFNDGPLAQEAVASIDEREPVETVVIDDASTEPDTRVALDELRAQGVRVERHEVNRGLSAARRTGLAATSAPYVFPLDSDDLLVPGALERLADRLDADPDAAASWGEIPDFGTRETRGSIPPRLDPYRVAFRNDFPVCSLFRRTALEEVGAWQDVGGQVGYEDWNLWMTLAERGRTAVHAGPGVIAVRHRLHGARMLGDAVRRHRSLYGEMRRTHSRLFAELAEHRRRTDLPLVARIGYPIVFGSRPPLGLANRARAVIAALRPRER